VFAVIWDQQGAPLSEEVAYIGERRMARGFAHAQRSRHSLRNKSRFGQLGQLHQADSGRERTLRGGDNLEGQPRLAAATGSGQSD
jgi:hypothetical protein